MGRRIKELGGTRGRTARTILYSQRGWRTGDDDMAYRAKQSSRHRDLLRHLRAVHLDDRHCNYYNESVGNKMYWRRHNVDKHH
jgi:hypothetical protein